MHLRGSNETRVVFKTIVKRIESGSSKLNSFEKPRSSISATIRNGTLKYEHRKCYYFTNSQIA